jgi:hypothetical protein
MARLHKKNTLRGHNVWIVALVAWRTEQEQKTWVQIPPGDKVLRNGENMAMLLCAIDLTSVVCVLKIRNQGIGPIIFIKNKTRYPIFIKGKPLFLLRENPYFY